jgi:transcriptional regulator with XRE-family HTH domain
MTRDVPAEDLPLIGDFGAWLRDERERAGVSLEAIAAQTKVARSLLEALERNDVSRWPAGIFRRSFVRSYAKLVGLDPDQTVALFLQAFPDHAAAGSAKGISGAAARAASLAVSRPEASPRLTLAPEVVHWQELVARGGAALTDLMAPVTLALPSGLFGGLSMFWVVLAVVAVLYLTVGTLVLGTTPGLWMMQWAGAHPLGARRFTWRRVSESPLDLGRRDADAARLEADAAHSR